MSNSTKPWLLDCPGAMGCMELNRKLFETFIFHLQHLFVKCRMSRQKYK